MDQNLWLSKRSKSIQQLILILSLFMVLVFLLFLFFQYSPYLLILLLISIIFSISLNFLFSRIYDVQIQNKKIIIKNLWKMISYPIEDLENIRLVRFIIPYPFNPYIVLDFNKKKYIYVLPNRFSVYFLKGGIKQYLQNLKEQISEHS